MQDQHGEAGQAALLAHGGEGTPRDLMTEVAAGPPKTGVAPRAVLGGHPDDAPALGVGDPETARTELLSEDAILFLERVHDVTRLLVDPACDGHDEELQHVGNRRQTGRASSVESARRTASIGFLDSTRSPRNPVRFTPSNARMCYSFRVPPRSCTNRPCATRPILGFTVADSW